MLIFTVKKGHKDMSTMAPTDIAKWGIITLRRNGTLMCLRDMKASQMLISNKTSLP